MKPSKPPKGTADLAPSVSGNEGKPPKMRDIPPRLPAIQRHLHGMPPPIRVKVKDGMGTPAPVMPTPNQSPTGGTRKRHRTR